MLAVFKCDACGYNCEEYFALFSQIPLKISCLKCKSEMRRTFGIPHIRGFSIIPGYERENENKLTLGKGIDFKQAWV